MTPQVRDRNRGKAEALSRLRSLLRRLRGAVPVRASDTVPRQQSPDAEPSPDKVKHWSANDEEFRQIKKACGRCREDDPCTFHGMAERRMEGLNR